VALSPETPAGGAPPQKSGTAGFIIGILLGLFVGATVLMLISFGTIAGLMSWLLPNAVNNSGFFQFLGLIPALALGWWAIVRLRYGMNFVSGSLIGLSVGMLGGVTLCSLMYSGLSAG
jgi:hypothetical protein